MSMIQRITNIVHILNVPFFLCFSALWPLLVFGEGADSSASSITRLPGTSPKALGFLQLLKVSTVQASYAYSIFPAAARSSDALSGILGIKVVRSKFAIKPKGRSEKKGSKSCILGLYFFCHCGFFPLKYSFFT